MPLESIDGANHFHNILGEVEIALGAISGNDESNPPLENNKQK